MLATVTELEQVKKEVAVLSQAVESFNRRFIAELQKTAFAAFRDYFNSKGFKIDTSLQNLTEATYGTYRVTLTLPRTEENKFILETSVPVPARYEIRLSLKHFTAAGNSTGAMQDNQVQYLPEDLAQAKKHKTTLLANVKALSKRAYEFTLTPLHSAPTPSLPAFTKALAGEHPNAALAYPTFLSLLQATLKS